MSQRIIFSWLIIGAMLISCGMSEEEDAVFLLEGKLYDGITPYSDSSLSQLQLQQNEEEDDATSDLNVQDHSAMDMEWDSSLIGSTSSDGVSAAPNEVRRIRDEADQLYVDGKTGASFILYEKAYQLGDAEAGMRLALCYIKGMDCPTDVDKGIQLLEEAAERGCTQAYQHLCRVYLLADNVRDYSKALEYAKTSSEYDQGKILAYMATYLSEEEPGLAFRCAELSAQCGCVDGIGCLANFYAFAVACQQDIEKSKELYRKIVDQVPPARSVLVHILSEQKEYEELYQILMKYVHDKEGNGDNGGFLAYHLGVMFYNGLNVERNINKAIFWFEIAAERGNQPAQSAIWKLYRQKKDYTHAHKWLIKAAETGETEAQVMLVRAFLFGEGCDRDSDQAYRWAIRANKQRSDALDDLLRELRARRELGDEYVENFLLYVENAYRDYAL